MFAGRVTCAALRMLEAAGARVLPPEKISERHRIGRRGEMAAYFYLRRQRYTMVARNFRSPLRHGEIDLIGWDGSVLCFIEVKTRSSDFAPPESAVDKKKREDVIAVAREYLRQLPPSCPWRCDLVSVYFDRKGGSPQFELFRDVRPLG